MEQNKPDITEMLYNVIEPIIVGSVGFVTACILASIFIYLGFVICSL